MIRHVSLGILATGLHLVVVTGAHAEQVRGALADLPLQLAHNADWRHGMGGSVALGVATLIEKHPALASVLLCLGDQPLVRAPQLLALLARHRAQPTRIIATELGGACGPPAVFPRDCFTDLLACEGPRGAQLLLRQQEERVVLVNDIDGRDVDTADDLAKVSQRLVCAARPQ